MGLSFQVLKLELPPFFGFFECRGWVRTIIDRAVESCRGSRIGFDL